MAYQAPAFYFYHAARVSGLLDPANITTAPTDVGISKSPLYDSRQGELYTPTLEIQAVNHDTNIDITGDTISNLVDTILFTGGNFEGNAVACFSYPTTIGVDANTLLAITTVPGPFEKVVKLDLTATPGTDDFITFRINPGVGPTGFIPTVSEVWFSQERAMERGPDPGWDHPWVRSQNRFNTPGGVTSTWKTGGDRKRYNMTWNSLAGADRQILLDMRDQTDGWTQPWFFRPPDTEYPIVKVELDRDANWKNDIDDPLTAGTTDEVTLNMIESLA